MSKIEEYREQSKLTNKITINLNHAQGLSNIGKPDPNNDKHSIGFYKNKIWDTDIPLWFHASFGYYGSSDCYTACIPEMQPYLTKALNHYKKDIINYIIEQAEHDQHMALLHCNEEAEQILAQINDVMIKENQYEDM